MRRAARPPRPGAGAAALRRAASGRLRHAAGRARPGRGRARRAAVRVDRRSRLRQVAPGAASSPPSGCRRAGRCAQAEAVPHRRTSYAVVVDLLRRAVRARARGRPGSCAARRCWPGWACRASEAEERTPARPRRPARAAAAGPAGAALEPRERRERTIAAARPVAPAASRQRPTAVVVEDAHWLDPESADVHPAPRRRRRPASACSPSPPSARPTRRSPTCATGPSAACRRSTSRARTRCCAACCCRVRTCRRSSAC